MPDAPGPSAREIALGRLLRVEHEGAYVARVGGRTGRDAEGGEAEARRASDYVAGVTRQRRWLDFLLARHVRGGLGRLDPALLGVLRMGAYDLAVRGVPPHAAVSEAVETAGRVMHRGAAGLANAVLRALARELPALPEPQTGDPAEDLAVRHSVPTWLVRRWLPVWGEATTRGLLDAANAAPRYGLRVVRGAGDRADVLADLAARGASAEASAWFDDFVVTRTLQPVLRGGLVDAGRVAVQDEAAGGVVRALSPAPGERLLDAAAAPGGKAVYAARLGAHVTALDVSPSKVRLVERAARNQGVRVETVAADLRLWMRAGAPFDAVLLDAPCSGTGVLAKRADLRWTLDPDRIREVMALQDALLDAAARHVRPGGRLVYATCSVERDENDARVEAFLARTPGFRLEPVGDAVPAALRDGPVYRALPHVHHTDGAFAARLRRDV